MIENKQEICEMCESGFRSVDGMTDYEIMPGLSKRVCIHCKIELERGAEQRMRRMRARQQKKRGVEMTEEMKHPQGSDYTPWNDLIFNFRKEINEIKGIENTLNEGEKAIKKRQELERIMHKYVDEGVEHVKKQNPNIAETTLLFFQDIKKQVTEYLSGDL